MLTLLSVSFSKSFTNCSASSHVRTRSPPQSIHSSERHLCSPQACQRTIPSGPKAITKVWANETWPSDWPRLASCMMWTSAIETPMTVVFFFFRAATLAMSKAERKGAVGVLRIRLRAGRLPNVLACWAPALELATIKMKLATYWQDFHVLLGSMLA